MFKVGDKVICTRAAYDIYYGNTYIVHEVINSVAGTFVIVSPKGYRYTISRFKKAPTIRRRNQL